MKKRTRKQKANRREISLFRQYVKRALSKQAQKIDSWARTAV